MFQQELKKYVTQNPDLVKMKEVAPGMFVLKYTKKVSDIVDNWDVIGIPEERV